MTGRKDLRPSAGGRKAFLLLMALAGLVSGCSAGQGIYHRVERGQTAYRIARTYGIDTRELLEINGIADPRDLATGQFLWIPGATGTRFVPPYEGLPERDSRLQGKKFFFPLPLNGTISSGYGNRGGRMHEGIDILAPEGTEVRAAAYGMVLYAGDGMRGYGNAVVLYHGDGVTTLYGHLRDFRIQSGDVVGERSVIGTVGSTGNATTSHLHFELRVEGEGVDPEPYLERAEDAG